MHARLQGLWDWWFWHRQLTGDLLDVLSDEHLLFQPGESVSSLARVFADMADTQRAYIDALQTRTLDFAAPDPSAPPAGVNDLRTAFGDLDRELAAALEAVDDNEIDTLRIRRDDEQIPVFILMSSLVESLLIFHGKASVYARLAGVTLPTSWGRYI